MKSPRGSINFDQRTNAVIVSDVESNLAFIREVVKKLDEITPQVLIEARIIETALNSGETLGLKWPSSLSAGATMPIRTHNFPWSSNKNNYLPSTGWVTPAITDGVAEKTTSAASLLTYGTLSLSDLNLTLDMLQTRSNTNVLSNPRIVTLDNQPAKIMVGNKYPLPKYTLSDTQDKVIVSGWEYIEYGLIFNVTPHVNGRGMITLDIEPVISDSSGTVAFSFGSETNKTTTDVPILTTESAKTNVMKKGGERLVIAGLIKDKKMKKVQKVPFLGSIPFLGKLFQHKTETTVKTELMIFLTPHIITLGMDSVNVTGDASGTDMTKAGDAVKVTVESVEAPRSAK